MASLKTEVAAIASLGLLGTVTCTQCAHPHPSGLCASFQLFPVQGGAHQPVLAVPWASEGHRRCSPGGAEEVPSLNSQRISLKEPIAFLYEPCPVDGSVGCFLLKRETKPLLHSPRDLSTMLHQCSDAVFSKAW